MIKETPLCKLAFKYGSDKCPWFRKHSYTPYYYGLFKNRRKTIKKVLEIGIGWRAASLLMWRDFFPKAKIYGVDYRESYLIKRDRIESILCDQRRKEHLLALIDKIGPDIDLVIDDGSHRPRDQIFTCINLMALFKKGVIYVIEDVADPGIVERFKGFDVDTPKLQYVNRYDNRLVAVRHKSGPSKGIIFYTDNQLNPKIASAVQAQLREISTDLNIPIINSSLEPMPNFGTINICFPNLKRSRTTMFKQTLAALEKSTADIIFFCEHDVLYHSSHFDFIPPRKDKFYYNQNWWMLRLTDGHAIRYDACKLSTLCAYRGHLLKEYRKRSKMAKNNHYRRNFWYEPGTHENNFEIWKSAYPVIDIRHDRNLTHSRWSPDQFRDKKGCQNWIETDDQIHGWGKTKEIITRLK